MKKAVSAFALVLALMAVGSMPTVIAQAQPFYTVEKGDALYTLTGLFRGDPTKWPAVVKENPYLKESGRIFERDGKIIVLIRPGEKLYGLEEIGIIPTPLPIDQLKPAPMVAPPEERKTEATTTATGFPLWGWFLIAVFVASIGYLMIRDERLRREGKARARAEAQRREERERQLAMNPATSGTPYVPGGILPSEPERLETFFERQAVDTYVQRMPGVDRATIRVERIGPIQRGMLAGEGLVRYLGQEPQPRRFDPPVPGYQARFRMPDGTEEILQSLQGCMNPVVSGGETLSGFTFTPVEEVVPTPTPEVPIGPRAVPAIAARVPAEQVLVAMGSLQFHIPAGSVFRAGEGGEILLTVASPCDIRIQQRKKASRPKAVHRTAMAE